MTCETHDKGEVTLVNLQPLFARLGGIEEIGGEKLAPMQEAEIVEFEKKIGVGLPEAYRQFLGTYGASTFTGASPDNPYILFRPLKPLPAHFKSGKGLFHAFYGTERDTHDGFSLQVRTHFFSGRMPKTMIPIGDDGVAGQICLGISGAELGKVYYWDQQNEPQDEEDYLDDYGEPRPPEALFQNVHLIADSFEDFLQRLELDAD